ncbi:BZ3500_MvSof-1268-A1-R1_Chr1-1g00969 [Microbotryum saponariae]|uniref:BZ3500_MvSof-1268-A1-R1_Chr1-1g00969 protein n=1 Tax=Microbotryum saponariae TaxID=289078 RepID=A0A2X0L2X5_9BASI|nr:BZ3500_MvSof-1268-A1-R1_Chr1-1g00969 [Microbotryum saponariae]SCZ93061.1 BZ3501_MvSof-1269-A2-R1_Chr1-1g00566 [Microbotryum saponariae]
MLAPISPTPFQTDMAEVKDGSLVDCSTLSHVDVLDAGADGAPASSAQPNPFANRGGRFWLVFLALCVSCFLAALDLTAVSTALPATDGKLCLTYVSTKVAADFQSAKFSWVGSAYTLTSTALIPWTANLASIFGQRATLFGSLLLFATGSAVVGSARSMEVVILGRSIQGAGGGGILTMFVVSQSEILVVDLVPLADRGAFFAIIGAVWALASAIGPPIGGALASAGAWRWLFYLNIPLTGIASLLVMLFLRVKAPQTTFKSKIALIDYYNIVFVAGATATILGLNWGGETYPWVSYKVLVPLIGGILAMGLFLWLEKGLEHPTIPFDILRHRSSLLGLLTNFLHGIVALAAIYYLTVYFQAVKMATAADAGVHTFSLSFTIAPMAIIAGISVVVLGKYRLQNIVGWALTVTGFALTTLLRVHSSKAAWTGYPIVMGVGLGILYGCLDFPVLAPLKPSQQPHAMAFFGFTHSFGQVLGISLGASILQNELSRHLPPEVVSSHFANAKYAYSAIPDIHLLPEPVQLHVRRAFAQSLRTVWIVMIGLSGITFILSCFIEDVPLTTETDENWGVSEKKVEPTPSETGLDTV